MQNVRMTDMNRKVSNGYTPIHVVGVGRLGCNIVSRLHDQKADYVTCSVCGYQYGEVYGSCVTRKLLLENENPFLISYTDGNAGILSNGCQEKLHELIGENTGVVVIVADMGDVVGRSIAPIIAQKARTKAEIVLGVACIPREVDDSCVEDGVEAFRQKVDAISCVNIDEATGELLDIVQTLYAVFYHICQVDLGDCREVLCDGRYAIISNRKGRGERRMYNALYAIKSSILANGWSMKGFDKVIFIIYTSPEHEMHVDELDDVDELMEELDPDVDFSWGLATDNTLKDEINISFIASMKK